MVTHKKIIAFVGMPGSGKGTCTDYLHGAHKWPLLHFGTMVYEEVQRRGLHNVNDEVFVRLDMRQKEGPAVLAKHIAAKTKSYLEKGSSIIVLDGLYSWTEYKYLKEQFGEDLVVIALAAPLKLRHERVLARKDSHRTYTLKELIARETDEIENLEKGGPIAIADYTIVNDSEPYELINQLDSLLHQLGIGSTN